MPRVNSTPSTQRSRRPNIRKGTIPRRIPRASSSAAPTNQSGCSTMASLAASGKVEIQNPEKPSGERVFTLNGADDQSGLLSWQAAEVGAARKDDRRRQRRGSAPHQSGSAVARGRPQAAQVRHDHRHYGSTGGRQDAVRRRVRRPRFTELRSGTTPTKYMPRWANSEGHTRESVPDISRPSGRMLGA